MAVTLKPLPEQVLLITGASSGIGLVTARRAAGVGAKVVLVARNEETLRQAVEQIKADGGTAVYAVADVADPDQIKAAADTATNAFGRIDTWVNNAGVGLFADITKNAEVDDKKVFETNFWGIVHGSRVAVQYLRDNGGALINLGSEVSDITTPTQGMYAASKHAVLGFTDAFRQEILKSELPISVTLIKPAAVDTPFAKHAKNNTETAATLPAPVYSPELVADQILHAAEFGGRELYVGGGGRAMVLLAEHFPSIADWFIARFISKQERKEDQPADHSNEALHDVGGGAYEERGGLKEERMVRERSIYGLISRHPVAATFITAAASAGLAYVLFKRPEPEPTRLDRVKRALNGYATNGRQAAESAAQDYAERAKAKASGYASAIRDIVSDYAERARTHAGEYGDLARDAVHGYADRARHTAHDYAETARDTAADYADAARGRANSFADRARSRTADGVDVAHDVLHDHVLKPAEQVLETVRTKLHGWLGK
ncbi:MAG: SDR family oxidoreductase [Tepidisphaeraceae bacterium]